MRFGLRRRTRAAWFMSILISVSVIMSSGLAYADTNTQLDPDDSPGRFDIVAARHGHRTTADGKRLLKHRVVTYETWESLTLARKNTYFLFRFAGDFQDRTVRVTATDNGKLVAIMVAGKGRTIGKVAVGRPDKHSLTIAFPRRFLGESVHRYRWLVGSSYQADPRGTKCGPPGPDKKVVVPPDPSCPDRLSSFIGHRLS